MNRHRPIPARTATPSRFGDRGASLVEYALLVALIAVVSIAAVTSLGDTASDTIRDGADGIENAPTTTAGVGCSDIHADGYATGPEYHTDCFSPTWGPYNL